MASVFGSLNHETIRVIAHLDLDCFYAQVEARHAGLPDTTPVAVSQWGSMLAVSYSARPFGIKRGMREAEAKQKCPDIVIIHVPTITHEDDEVDDDGASASSSSSSSSGASAAAGATTTTTSSSAPASPPSSSASTSHNRKEEKVPEAPPLLCRGDASQPAQPATPTTTTNTAHHRPAQVCLNRYREASQHIFDELSVHFKIVERASIDEAYIDLTAEAHAEAQAGAGVEARRATGGAQHGALPPSTFVVDDASLTSMDRPLIAGARVIARVRASVKEKLNYTVSAGISHNKLLSKLASARNKPDKITLVPYSEAAAMIGRVKVTDINGFGGKLGKAVAAALGETATASDVLATRCPPASLAARCRISEDHAAALLRVCQGEGLDQITPNLQPKSLNACKSFSPTTSPEELGKWLDVLSRELAARVVADQARWHRRPRTVTIHHRGGLKADHLQNW